jgi:hypothetical protein
VVTDIYRTESGQEERFTEPLAPDFDGPLSSVKARVDIKIVQDMLGDASRAITSDTYTTVLPGVASAAAEAAAALMPTT